MKRANRSSVAYLRTAVFGIEDSLVSTVGLLSGIAAAGVSRSTIVLTGVILIAVEAFSMAVGSLVSENTAEEYENHTDVPLSKDVGTGVVMFVSYIISGFVPLAPYFRFDVPVAFPLSILLSLGALFILGAVGGRVSHVSILKNGFRMLVVGGLAIAVGALIGGFLPRGI